MRENAELTGRKNGWNFLKKKLIKYTGSAIAVLSVIYILRSLKKTDWSAVSSSFSLYWLPVIILLVAMYMLVNLIRAYNWTRIVHYFGNKGKHDMELIILYLRTEVAKYIPSNMVHFAGRHIYARELGYKDSVLLASNVFDMVLLLAVAMVIVSAGLVAEIIQIPRFILDHISGRSYKTGVIILTSAGMFILLLLLKTRKEKFMEYIRVNKVYDLLVICLMFLPGFFLSTLILMMIYRFMLCSQVGIHDSLFFFTAFTMAWTAGFIIPGAPGGIGVREAVILVLFGGLYGENTTVIAAILMRIVSIAGDAGVWAAAAFYEKYSLNSERME